MKSGLKEKFSNFYARKLGNHHDFLKNQFVKQFLKNTFPFFEIGTQLEETTLSFLFLLSLFSSIAIFSSSLTFSKRK